MRFDDQFVLFYSFLNVGRNSNSFLFLGGWSDMSWRFNKIRVYLGTWGMLWFLLKVFAFVFFHLKLLGIAI